MEENVRRRRRVRMTSASDSTVDTPAVADPEPVGAPPDWGTQAQADSAASERGLRGLVGGGSSQVSVAAAMRARDAARPTEDELAHAEAEVVVVRRHWTPREQEGSADSADQAGRAGKWGRADS
jgi:hypothetical protein